LFLRGPMTVSAEEHCKLRLPLKPPGRELPPLPVRIKLTN